MPELVYWRDAHFSLDDFSETPEDYIVKTVGWVKEEGHFLRIESERLPRGDGARAVSRVPRENVVRRVPLTESPTK